jgi:ABC-2 type transport system ATP-binding protein
VEACSGGRGVIEAFQLTRSFGGRLAVQDVTFSVRPGEIFALLGPNGAGKTTILRMLAGLIAPSRGTVAVDGIELTPRSAENVRSRVGFLPEAPGLWDRLSVEANLLVYARLYGLQDPAGRVRQLLDFFRLADRAADPAAQLSKGMKQKVALARMLLHEPAVLLLDEPTSGLDPHTAVMVRELVLQLTRTARAILISTHNLDEAERLADRVAVLQRRLVAVDTPAALRQRLFGRRLRVRLAGDGSPFRPVLAKAGYHDAVSEGASLSIGVDDFDARAPEIVRLLVHAGAEIRSVLPDEPPLEKIYLKLMEESAGG